MTDHTKSFSEHESTGTKQKMQKPKNNEVWFALKVTLIETYVLFFRQIYWACVLTMAEGCNETEGPVERGHNK